MPFGGGKNSLDHYTPREISVGKTESAGNMDVSGQPTLRSVSSSGRFHLFLEKKDRPEV